MLEGDVYPVTLAEVTGGTEATRAAFYIALAFILLFFVVFDGQGQSLHGDASRIFTDYKGYWTSEVGNISKTKPDNSHNLLGFSWMGETYSTGVNDSQLISKGVTFHPAQYQAFPVRNIESTTGTYIGWGQMKDGINDGIASSPPFPTPPILANYLTDGLNGLDIGTGVANIKAGVLVFNFTGIIDREQIADGHPDILVTQMANPQGTKDEVYLTDSKGNKVGRSIFITYSSTASVGVWTADFYHLNGTQATFENEDRNLWLWGAELSAFGINESNYRAVTSMRYKLNGSSDPAFAAYKVGVFDIISANNDEAESEKGEEVEINVLENDQPSSYLDPRSVRIKTAPTNGIVTTDPSTGAISYTPHSIFYGIDSFVYEVCSNASEADLCDEATVDVSVRAYILPISLLDFSASLSKDQQVKVEWTTTGELNNDYFEVQRSNNARDWEVIAEVHGAGDSNTNISYSVTDGHPLDGYNYYRLKQVDRNGDFRLFEVVSVKTKEDVQESTILYPNPSTDKITVKGAAAELKHLSIINSFGQSQHQNFKVTLTTDRQVVINLENLPSGIYVLRTATEGKIFRKL